MIVRVVALILIQHLRDSELVQSKVVYWSYIPEGEGKGGEHGKTWTTCDGGLKTAPAMGQLWSCGEAHFATSGLIEETRWVPAGETLRLQCTARGAHSKFEVRSDGRPGKTRSASGDFEDFAYALEYSGTQFTECIKILKKFDETCRTQDRAKNILKRKNIFDSKCTIPLPRGAAPRQRPGQAGACVRRRGGGAAAGPSPATHAMMAQLKVGETVHEADKIPKRLYRVLRL